MTYVDLSNLDFKYLTYRYENANGNGHTYRTRNNWYDH